VPPAEPPAPRTGDQEPPKNPNKPVKTDINGNSGQVSRGWYAGLCLSRLGRAWDFTQGICMPYYLQLRESERAVVDPPDEQLARTLPAVVPLDFDPTAILACRGAAEVRCSRARAALTGMVRAEARVASVTTALADAVDRGAGGRRLAPRNAAFSKHAQLTQIGAMKALSGQLASALEARWRKGRVAARRLGAAKLNVKLTAAEIRAVAAAATPAGLSAQLTAEFLRADVVPAEAIARFQRTAQSANGFDLRSFASARPRTAGLERFYRSMTIREVAEVQQTLAAGFTIRPSLHTKLGNVLERAYNARGRARSRAVAMYLRMARGVPGTGGALLRSAAHGL
jgi:hypothetical protein